MTVEEFARWRISEPDDFELVEGEVVPLSSATPKHARIRRILERKLDQFFDRQPIGEPFSEVDCKILSDTVRRPDLAVFLTKRLNRMDLNAVPVDFAPDIAVEILSLSESAMAVNRKIREYLAAGTGEVWVIDHLNQEVMVHSQAQGVRLLAANQTLETTLVPGFSTHVGDLFR